MDFRELGLEPALVAAVTALGYEEPTAIQQEAIPPLLAGRDALGQAATGTGKTAAFALPMLQRIAPYATDGESRTVRGLVVVPTRELAMQVAEATSKYGRELHARVLAIYGGAPFGLQARALARGVDIVVATPGRALDHLRRGTVSFANVRSLVLDEADEMLDMGFADELETLLAAVNPERQTALFSATMAKRILAIAQRHLRDPIRITIANETPSAAESARVRQVAYIVERRHKAAALARILDVEAPTSTIVFCRTRGEVDELAETLGARGYAAEPLHGGLSQEQRDRVLRRFREGTSDVLVATDVAARGLDIEHVSHVVNFDLPSSPDVYVHRIGRTGRAGREGVAITLVEPREQRYLRSIEGLTRRPIAIERVPTVHDLRERRMELTIDALRTALEDDGGERYRPVVERIADEYDLIDIASAALALVESARDGAADDEEEIPSPPVMPAREPRRNGAPRNGEFARLYVGLGRQSGVRPADLVGALTNEAHLDRRAIGAIQIADRFSLVELPSNAIDGAVRALRSATLRGKPMRPRRDRMG